jgi:hypothetical protein
VWKICQILRLGIEKRFIWLGSIMRAGRPAYHVSAKWLTVHFQTFLAYYALDSKGNLVKGPDGIKPHHVVDHPLMTQQRAPVATPVLTTVNAPPELPPPPVLPADPLLSVPEMSFDWADADYDPMANFTAELPPDFSATAIENWEFC